MPALAPVLREFEELDGVAAGVKLEVEDANVRVKLGAGEGDVV
jgi:hypothetical protein